MAMGLPQERQGVNIDGLFNIEKYPKDRILKNAAGDDIILVNKSSNRFAPNTITH